MPDPKIRSKSAVPHDKRKRILAYLVEHPGDVKGCAAALQVTPREVGKVIARRSWTTEKVALVKQNMRDCNAYREELKVVSYEAAILAEQPPDKILDRAYAWCEAKGRDPEKAVPHYVSLVKGQGVTAPRVLEGMGELDPQQDPTAERQRFMFNIQVTGQPAGVCAINIRQPVIDVPAEEVRSINGVESGD